MWLEEYLLLPATLRIKRILFPKLPPPAGVVSDQVEEARAHVPVHVQAVPVPAPEEVANEPNL